MPSTAKDIWETYVKSWKVESRAEKLELMGECLSAEPVYTDPLTQTHGREALADYMLNFHQQIPGGHFITTWFLDHHDRSIARWEMRDGQGQAKGEGISYGTYDAKGRLTSMTGFFEVP